MTEWSEICCLFVTVHCGDGSGDKIRIFVRTGPCSVNLMAVTQRIGGGFGGVQCNCIGFPEN